MPARLRGVIAATITPVDNQGTPDIDRLILHADYLLANGCDGINLLGTTGEATSFGIGQRIAVMRAVSESGLPMSRFMVGTGTAALADTALLTRTAGDLGFAGALVLPPFYYKGIGERGLLDFFAGVVGASELPLYLYNFPALSGIAFSPELVAKMIDSFGGRIAGLKDSSGDLDYAAQIAALAPNLSVFPSNEGSLDRARAGEFAGCISATANLNSPACALAFHQGDNEALRRAIGVRSLLEGLPLVPAVKALAAELHAVPSMAATVPPLIALADGQSKGLWANVRTVMERQGLVDP